MSADKEHNRVKSVLGQDLWESIQCVEALSESAEALARFEQAIARRSRQAITGLHKEIAAGLKAVEKETGYNWEPYLEGFNVYDWLPGEFQRHIAEWLKEELQTPSQSQP